MATLGVVHKLRCSPDIGADASSSCSPDIGSLQGTELRYHFVARIPGIRGP